jgi:hypothetical protein
MIPVEIHYRGATQERRRVAAVPVVGAYLYGPGADRRLWEADAVVFDGAAVAVYAIGVCPVLAGELQAAWATWGETGVLTETEK